MQENEFEKKVQQSMEELQLKPSDEVWQNVATAITQKKRNKSFFWIFSSLFFLLIAGILGWNYFMNGQGINTAAVKQIDTSNQSTIAAPIHSVKQSTANVEDSSFENSPLVIDNKSGKSNGSKNSCSINNYFYGREK